MSLQVGTSFPSHTLLSRPIFRGGPVDGKE